ncbi:3-methyladenine DNA glycosylase AlkD [Mesobacillus persicus]|uniref:3-methyladenine DNA glycosylase AlkD n=1 Tax=Mesobacillus persicus TaxID=930146 RepID=A0A1H8GLX3_9BACI|nr:DNA alkylation repair protein [Mesobacillus persicus]SEN44996.1 3-methyladenine DNA glycosylase AlkD [Mesobacillus persicus]
MKELVGEIRERFAEKANKENAEQMSKYLKNHFTFFGIKTPLRREIVKGYFHETELLKKPFSEEFVLSLWAEPEREFQMVAADYIVHNLKNLKKQHIDLMEQLITTKTWWDSVDTLASKPVGKIVADHPELITERLDRWAVSENMWLRRTSIIFQLKYKAETDENLLYRYIKINADSKEFFIQKAIGWALREYSKTNPESVRNFIETNKLAPLSVREGGKHLPKK